MKLKKLIVLILLFTSSFLNVQFEKGALYFKDGAIMEVFIHKFKFDAIQFKTEKATSTPFIAKKTVFPIVFICILG